MRHHSETTHRRNQMKNSRSLLLLIALSCFALLGAGLYLQLVEHMLPCPLCIIQRYAFVAVGLFCLLGALLQGVARTAASLLAALAAIAGVGTASWHLWVQAHPGVSCGIDPMETALNTIPSATLLPLLFKADGLCATPYAPILGLSIPQWSLLWFVLFVLVLVRVTFKRDR
jgi:disulfide bond formation protein DsbB